jgi:PII-like signaling protein
MAASCLAPEDRTFSFLEFGMHGYQITFFTQQDRRHGNEPLAQWLLAAARQLGIRGATLTGALQGLGHDGITHSVNLFDQGDQPVQVTMVVSHEEDVQLFTYLDKAQVHLFFVKTAVEFGTLGPQDAVR